MEVEDVDSSSGVTSGAQEAPVTEDAPQSAGESPTPEQGEVKPKSENRYQKLANEAKRYKTEAQQYQEKLKAHEGAIALHQVLSSDPQKARLLQDLMDQNRSKEIMSKIFGQQEDPYKDFAPEVAERFRKLDALEKWKEDQERNWAERSKSDQERTIQNHRNDLDNEFNKLLSDSGFLKDGVSTNERRTSLLERATLTALIETAQDPNFPTKEELKTAYDSVISDLSEIEKLTLKQTVKPSGVPASGSVIGKTLNGKVDYSLAENRIKRLMSA